MNVRLISSFSLNALFRRQTGSVFAPIAFTGISTSETASTVLWFFGAREK
jgi:hypothetical protein